MTLILTYASARYVLQVTDRLVTQGGKIFDPLANKNLIYVARDAIVTVGYGYNAESWGRGRLKGNQ
jgi:hypothetical protein